MNAPTVKADGSPGFATRYWDCCKPTCGWRENVGGRTPVSSCNSGNGSLGGDYGSASACSGGGAFMCWGYSPWTVSTSVSYGFAAFNSGGCGKCYQLTFMGNSHNSTNDAGSASLAGKTMTVQVINTGGIQGGQFDLLVPGGGVGDFDACSRQWGTSDLGERYGGIFLACQKQNGFDYAKSVSCATQKCSSLFGSKSELLAGCKWFVEWYGLADNPALSYKEVSCPNEITSKSGLR